LRWWYKGGGQTAQCPVKKYQTLIDPDQFFNQDLDPTEKD
jgi:hypothetical protein